MSLLSYTGFLKVFSVKKTLEEHKKAFYYFIKTQSHQSHFKVDKVHLRVKLGLLSNLPSPPKNGGWMLRNNSYSESKTQDSKEIMTSIKNSPQPVLWCFIPSHVSFVVLISIPVYAEPLTRTAVCQPDLASRVSL